MKFIKKFFPIIAVLVLSFWAIKPLLAPGFFPMHDNTQVARVFEMHKSLAGGMLPVRWVEDLGYGFGYPIFNFYAPLAYYFGGLLMFFGLNALVSAKIMMATGILLAGVFMYLLTREFWGEAGGIVSALFYVYAPYHAVDIYVRGDVGEFWAYAFIPLMFLGLFKIFMEGVAYPRKKVIWVIVEAVGFAGIILSHNLTALMVAPFLLIVTLLYCFVAFRKNELLTIRYSLYAIFLGLSISAFYWLPALLEMKYTNVLSQIVGGANFRENFVCLSQLWTSPWGFGGSIPGCVDGMSFMIGKLHILVTLAALVLAVIFWKKYSDKAKIIVFSFVLFLISVFFTLAISSPIWSLISPMAFLQYPWRFLVFASFFTSLCAGGAVYLLRDIFVRMRLNFYLYIGAIVAVIAALLYLSVKFFNPQNYTSYPASFYTHNNYLEWTVSKISHEYLQKNVLLPKTQQQLPLTNFSLPPVLINVENQKNLFIYFQQKGKIPPVIFRETLAEKLSNLISIIGIIAFIALVIKVYVRKN